MNSGTVFISGEFGKLTFGDVSSAARAAAGDLYGVGLTGLGDLNEVAYLDRAGAAGFNNFVGSYVTGGIIGGQNYDTGALYEYSIDGFTGYIGLSQNNVDRSNPLNERKAIVVSVGAAYTFEGITGAIGYEQGRATSQLPGTLINPVTGALVGPAVTSFGSSHLVASLEYEMDMFKAKVFAGQVGSDLGDALDANAFFNNTHYGVSAEGSFDATTVTAFAYRGLDGNTDFGIGAAYDLGGGASIKGGIARDKFDVTPTTTDTTTVADLGLAFTF
jgi:outer membrane protein OmpU